MKSHEGRLVIKELSDGRVMSKKICLIVGASRSGTTFVGRLISSLGGGYCLPELHFFEQFADINRLHEPLTREEIKSAVKALLSACENGYLNTHKPANPVTIRKALESIPDRSDYIKVYVHTLISYMEMMDFDYVVDQTPRNIFFYRILQSRYPEIFCVINMIRDPRSVLFSYRKKWLQTRLGVQGFKKREIFRTLVSYDPIVTSILWRSAVRQSTPDSDTVLNLQYEQFVSKPEVYLAKISQRFRLGDLKNVPLAIDNIKIQNSSFHFEGESTGVSTSSTNRWAGQKGLSSHELKVCELICNAEMEKYDYCRTYGNIGITSYFALVMQLLPTLTRGLIIVMVNRSRSKTPIRSMFLRITGRD